MPELNQPAANFTRLNQDKDRELEVMFKDQAQITLNFVKTLQ